ncbi:unnamed protein product [Durusdinium trenchii]|uniref:RING-type domain-containing protein n=2 Tax=Durusdinium trenchii TaxID=1381693 RepID=A0ABP0HTG7_9DINO
MMECAICYEQCEPLSMPCCGKEGATVAYCRPCLEVICQLGGGVGRCPTCRQCLRMDDGVPSITENRGQCQMCRQMHILVDQGMCEACNLGRRYVFRYECQRCHRLQRIPHPMWRYQATPTDFSSSTWACHQGCGDYTTWRLAPEDVGQVPDMECPESWGRREEWLEQVRRLRHSGQRPETSPRCVVS